MGFCVQYDNSLFLNIDGEHAKQVEDINKATVFEDRYSANFLADVVEMKYTVVRSEDSFIRRNEND